MLAFLADYYLYTLSLSPTSSTETSDAIEDDIEFAFRTLLNNAAPEAGVLCGCASQMFRTISKATAVSRRLYDEFTSEAGPSGQTLHDRRTLYDYVRFWSPESTGGENAAIACVYQKALLVLLSQAEPRASDDNPEMEALLADIFGLLQNIPIQSNTTTVLAWPLAIVAPCVMSRADQAFILRYLGAVIQKYGFGNHRQTEQLLQLVWSRQDLREQGPYCLPRAMEARGFRFMLC